MWPFKHKTLYDRYSKLMKMIMSIDSHFEITENEENSVRLHLPNYKGNQPMDFHIYLLEPFLYISFVTELEGEKISVLNNYHQSISQQDMFNMAMANNLNRIHQFLNEKYEDDIDEDEKKEVTHDSFEKNVEPLNNGIPEEVAIKDLKENFDYNESFKKHALTFMILRPNTEFWYYANINEEKPLWIYNGEKDEKDESTYLKEDGYSTGKCPFIWYIKKYNNKEELCWMLDFLNRLNVDLWPMASTKAPQELIREITRFVPSLRIGNDPQRIKTAIEWAWVDVHSFVRFINYCMNSLDWTRIPDDKSRRLQNCNSIQELAYLMIKESGFEYIPNNKECDKGLTIVESLPLSESAGSHGHMKFAKSYIHTSSEAKEDMPKVQKNQYFHAKVKECARKLLLSLGIDHQKELDENLLLAELTIVSAAMVQVTKDEWKNKCNDFVEHKILDNFLSIKEIYNYDDWIVNNTPGMYSNDSYTTETAIPLVEFEKRNGEVKFFRINAYPYDNSLWGEFVDKKGNKQIIYVNQGFPFEYSMSELIRNKTSFGIVEEKDTYYHSKRSFYCLKEIRKRHSMLSSYIKGRLVFYKETIKKIQSNKNKGHVFQLYNAITNEILNFNAPYLGTDDLTFGAETVVNGKTAEIYQYDENSLNNFSMCIEECLRIFRHEFKNAVFNLDQAIADNLSVGTDSIRTDDIENDSHYKIKETSLNSVTDEKGVVYDNDYQTLHFNSLPLDTYSVKTGVKVINDFAFRPEEWKKDDGTTLQKLHLPNSIVLIGAGAFAFNQSLEDINIPENAEISHYYNPFAGCLKLHVIKWESKKAVKKGTLVYNEGRSALIACLPWHYIGGVVKSWSLLEFAKQHGKMQVGTFTNKETGADFKSCIFTNNDGIRIFVAFSTALGELTPNEIVVMKNELQVVQLESGNYSLCKGKTIIEQESHVEVPNGIKVIAAKAFYQNKRLQEISLPDSLEFIGHDAFKDCSSIRSIIVPKGTLPKFEKIIPELKGHIVERDDLLPF